MSRNKDRLGMGNSQPQNIPTPPQQTQQGDGGGGFSFVVPTEFVDLPSKGRFYSDSHPLHNTDVIEIKQMTAKEEDMLTSRSLLKKGVALDRALQSVIINKSINSDTLLVGDRNAILVAMRVSGYGNMYDTQITCPACTTQQNYSFDLNNTETYYGDTDIETNLEDIGNGHFSTVLPRTGLAVIFRLMSGTDEKRSLKLIETARKLKKDENAVTTQLRSMLVSVGESTEQKNIDYVVDNMPTSDSRHLRLMYKMVTPNVDMTQEFTCNTCDHEQELEVPLTADFFWPDR